MSPTKVSGQTNQRHLFLLFAQNSALVLRSRAALPVDEKIGTGFMECKINKLVVSVRWDRDRGQITGYLKVVAVYISGFDSKRFLSGKIFH